MSVSVQGFTVDPHTIRDQETQQPKPWTSIVSAEKANGLAKVLKARVEGEVRFDDMSRALYSTDASNYRQVPIGVVIPKTIDDVVTTIACCREYGAPFLSRGGGTSLCGQSCNAAVMADFSKYLNRIIGIDFEKKLARVQPGCNLDILRNAAEKHHLTFGPDPSTHDHNTLGGMMGNNSCGVHSVYAGRTADNVEELDIVTYRGLRLKVGRTSPSELRGIIAAGGAKGEIYRRLAALRDRYADLIRRNYPKNSPPRLRVQSRRVAARERVQRRARAHRLRRNLRHHPRSHAEPRSEPAQARRRRDRLPGHLPGGRRRSLRPRSWPDRP